MDTKSDTLRMDNSTYIRISQEESYEAQDFLKYYKMSEFAVPFAMPFYDDGASAASQNKDDRNTQVHGACIMISFTQNLSKLVTHTLRLQRQG